MQLQQQQVHQAVLDASALDWVHAMNPRCGTGVALVSAVPSTADRAGPA